jgi:hypothetical protein
MITKESTDDRMGGRPGLERVGFSKQNHEVRWPGLLQRFAGRGRLITRTILGNTR